MIDHMLRMAVAAALAAAAVAQTNQGSQFHPQPPQPRAAQACPQASPQTGGMQGDVRPTQVTMQDDHGRNGAAKPLLARELFHLIDRNGDGRIDDGEAMQFRAAVERVVREARERQLQRTKDGKEIHGDLREIRDDRQDLRDDKRDVRDDLRDGDLRDLRDDRKDLRDDRQDLRDDRQDLQQDLRQRAADRPQGMPAPSGEVRLQTVRAPAAPRTAPVTVRR
jgi:hypothetical protein